MEQRIGFADGELDIAEKDSPRCGLFFAFRRDELAKLDYVFLKLKKPLDIILFAAQCRVENMV